MEDVYSLNDLLPCPRCKSGETRWEFKHLSPRMTGPGEMISATILHWCERLEGCQSMITRVTGRTREDVVSCYAGVAQW